MRHPRSSALALCVLTIAILHSALPATLGAPLRLEVPASDQVQYLAVPVDGLEIGAAGVLVELGGAEPQVQVPAQVVPPVAADGRPAEGQVLLAIVPPGGDAGQPRSFHWQPSATGDDRQQPALRWVEANDVSVRVEEGQQPVLAYNHGTITDPKIPEDDPRRAQSCYIHPLWGLNGEVLTDDFPADHYHHHGVFWTWPHVEIEGQHYDLWASKGDIRQQFIRWLHREAGPVAAVMGVENGWFVGDRQVMTERIWLRAYRSAQGERAIDLQMVFLPTDRPVTLKGSAGKSYGGLTVRFDVWPRRDPVIRVPERTVRHVGRGLESSEDLPDTRLAWADMSSHFPQAPNRSGASVFIPPDHPDYPPSWLIRCYGPLCVGWPGVEGRTFQPQQPFTLEYRLWLHGAEVEHDQLEAVYKAYCDSRARGVERSTGS